jgi:hypothetical protein
MRVCIRVFCYDEELIGLLFADVCDFYDLGEDDSTILMDQRWNPISE